MASTGAGARSAKRAEHCSGVSRHATAPLVTPRRRLRREARVPPTRSAVSATSRVPRAPVVAAAGMLATRLGSCEPDARLPSARTAAWAVTKASDARPVRRNMPPEAGTASARRTSSHAARVASTKRTSVAGPMRLVRSWDEMSTSSSAFERVGETHRVVRGVVDSSWSVGAHNRHGDRASSAAMATDEERSVSLPSQTDVDVTST
mmetsp:Transcript_9582/g.30380  ORF Transcript_9582/g.30380 Transcript_9582/m.30380 type:complete len:206 (+) Transcript_9582:1318-1935(+)